MTEDEVYRRLLSLLNADESFIGMLSVYTPKKGKPYPMLVQGCIAPEQWSINATSCIIFTEMTNARLEFTRMRLCAYCRAPSYISSRALAAKMQGALNRRCGDGFFIVTNILKTLPPLDGEVDNYNTPVEILVRAA